MSRLIPPITHIVTLSPLLTYLLSPLDPPSNPEPLNPKPGEEFEGARSFLVEARSLEIVTWRLWGSGFWVELVLSPAALGRDIGTPKS